MGRTGKLWAHEWSNIKPDIMTLAKALGNGFPIGSVLATEEVAKSLVPGKHGTTFGGNPLAMAVANAVLDEMLDGEFLENVLKTSKLLRSKLERLIGDSSTFSEVRGMGLMLGLQCVGSNIDLMSKLRENGLLTVVADCNTLRLLPPLIIDESHVEEACTAVARACNYR